MLAAAERWGGGEDERPYLPRAFSFARATPRAGRARRSCSRTSAPARAAGASSSPAKGSGSPGPLGHRLRAARGGRAPLLVGGGIGAAPLLCWHDELGADATVLLGFRCAAHAEAAASSRGEPQVATDDGSPATRPRDRAAARGARRRLDAPTSTPAARRRCSRPCGRCRRARFPAQLALESGMACGFGACFGCVVPTQTATCASASTARCSMRPSSRPRWWQGGTLSGTDGPCGVSLPGRS